MISSLCTIANAGARKELEFLIATFRLFHPDIPIYIGCDSTIVRAIVKGEVLPPPGIKLHGIIPDSMTPKQNCPEWTKLMLKKTEIMDIALAKHADTLFVDADMLFLAEIKGIPIAAEVALSPHYINKRDEDQYGRYNGGYAWTRAKAFPQWWRDATPRSKYYEQECLVHAKDDFTVGILEQNHNYSWWRLDQVDRKERKSRLAKFRAHGQEILYNRKPLISVHTHIMSRDRKFASINSLTRNLLKQSGSAKHHKILRLIGD